jgi:hypothetical protein
VHAVIKGAFQSKVGLVVFVAIFSQNGKAKDSHAKDRNANQGRGDGGIHPLRGVDTRLIGGSLFDRVRSNIFRVITEKVKTEDALILIDQRGRQTPLAFLGASSLSVKFGPQGGPNQIGNFHTRHGRRRFRQVYFDRPLHEIAKHGIVIVKGNASASASRIRIRVGLRNALNFRVGSQTAIDQTGCQEYLKGMIHLIGHIF